MRRRRTQIPRAEHASANGGRLSSLEARRAEAYNTCPEVVLIGRREKDTGTNDARRAPHERGGKVSNRSIEGGGVCVTGKKRANERGVECTGRDLPIGMSEGDARYLAKEGRCRRDRERQRSRMS
jgi:hypothetical protein